MLKIRCEKQNHLSPRHFFANMIFSATSNVPNYQNKTGKKSYTHTNTYYIFQGI